MPTNDRIAAYARISVDDELDNPNVSIENQKSIIADSRFISFLFTFAR